MRNFHKSEKGIASIVFILIILVLIGVIVYLYMDKISSSPASDVNEETSLIIKEEAQNGMEEGAFEEIPEDETTPEEINNEKLKELDSIVESVESIEEDFSDLEL